MRTQVDLLAVAADTVRDAHVRSPHRIVKLGDFEPVTVSGDQHRLRQVTANLVANALQHTPAGAHVTLRVGRGPVEAASPAAGAGLGLAIVSTIVKAHGGRVELSTAPGRGATFRVILPL